MSEFTIHTKEFAAESKKLHVEKNEMKDFLQVAIGGYGGNLFEAAR